MHAASAGQGKSEARASHSLAGQLDVKAGQSWAGHNQEGQVRVKAGQSWAGQAPAA